MSDDDQPPHPASEARRPDNLALLHAAFGREAIEAILPGDTFEVDGVEFVCKYAPGSTATRFHIVKPLAFVEQFRALCRQFPGAAIVELGIAEGGSTALLALDAAPRRLVAVDLEPDPLRALAAFIEQRGLGEVVRPYYGVDQSDRRRLASIVDAEFGGDPLDLVIDDASHQYEPTRASFEVLFPRLRPGGIFAIEDWNAAVQFRDAVARALRDPSRPDHEAAQEQLRAAVATGGRAEPDRPLLDLVVELLLARASSGAVVDELTIGPYWVQVRRGPAPLDPATFRLDDHVSDHFRYLGRTRSRGRPARTRPDAGVDRHDDPARTSVRGPATEGPASDAGDPAGR